MLKLSGTQLPAPGSQAAAASAANIEHLDQQARLPQIETPAIATLLTLKFPSHDCAVENALLTFGRGDKLVVDLEIASRHDHIIRVIASGDGRSAITLPSENPLEAIQRHAHRAAAVFLGEKNSTLWLERNRSDEVAAWTDSRLILTSKAGLPETRTLNSGADSVIEAGHFSTVDTGLFQSMRLMAIIRGITGSSEW